MENASVWRRESKSTISFPRLENDIEVDIAIIGGGITGLTTAFLLKDSGYRVAILEAHKIGAGTTGFSSCHLTTDADYSYRQTYKDYNDETLKTVADSRVKAIDFIESIVKNNNIHCDFRRLPGYLYTEKEEELANLKEELKYAGKAGLAVSWSEKAPLPFKTLGAVRFENQGEFNAQEYLQGLSKNLNARCQVYEDTFVVDIKEENGSTLVKTSGGTVKAKTIIEATHLPIFFNVLQTVSIPYRSYMVAAKISDDQYPEGLYWDMNEPYHYTRVYQTENGKWLVVGGEDHKTGHVKDTSENYRRLEEYVKQRFKVSSIDFKWSAQYYEPADGLPYIGRSPFSKNVYVATGFSGDGLVYGTVAGIILADLLMGRENAWAEVFDSTRINPLVSAPEFLKAQVDVTKNFISDRFTSEGEDINVVAKGEGKILDINGEKLAVSRDENDEVHAVSPVCTHMKCYVHWNGNEKSWDCPCHGSRFSMKGEVIIGPATMVLENKEEVIKVHK